MLLSGVVIAGLASTGHAQPGQVPDGGSRPSATGQIALPDGSPARPPTSREVIDGPLAAEIAEIEIEIESVTQRLQSILPEVGPAITAAEHADQQWRLAADQLAAAQATLDELVGESFRGAAALPPDLYLPQLRSLTAHAPVPVEAPLGVQTAARQLVEAREAEAVAAELVAATQDAEQTLTELREELEAELAGLREQLTQRRERNAELIAAQARAREEAAQADAAQRFPELAPVAGFRAHADAVRAVRFALSQLGKPYLWGAEGPDRYDCSGLVWAAYRSVGEQLPRVAADQYQGTAGRVITRSAAVAQQGLLPGDLVFFSSGPTWQSIHHVGIYVGGGQMVHAPNRNEVVKVSPVWWSRFFAATRVIDAVPVSGSSPSPTPPPPGGQFTPPPTQPGSPTPSPEPTTVPVPSLAGMTGTEAEAAIQQAGLEPVEGEPIPEGCAPGVVAGQTPAAETRVLVGAEVTYQICTAVIVPEVGAEREAAEAALRELGFEVAVTLVESDATPGQVVGTDPPAGARVAPGSEIVLRIAGVLVPELVELTCEEALERLADLDLTVAVEEGTAAEGDPGTVENQQPPAGQLVTAGSEVTLVVHGPEGCAADQNDAGGEGGGTGVADPGDAAPLIRAVPLSLPTGAPQIV